VIIRVFAPEKEIQSSEQILDSAGNWINARPHPKPLPGESGKRSQLLGNNLRLKRGRRFGKSTNVQALALSLVRENR
jgi:hypothetical protein